MFSRLATYIILIIVVLYAYVRYYERKLIYFPEKEIDCTPHAIGLKYEDVFFKTSDGVGLHGWFIPAEAKRATLLFCHGNAGNISHRIEPIRLFNELGLDVFIFDYRGYGKSQGYPSETGLYKDAEAAYGHLLARKDIDADKIVIYGESIGANVAIELATRAKIAAIISEGAFTSAKDMGKRLFPYLPVKWIISIEYDALSKIKDVHIPKLIIHSKDDEIIPFSHGKRLFEAGPEPKEFYMMRGGHNEAFFMGRDEFSRRVDLFLKKYLE